MNGLAILNSFLKYEEGFEEDALTRNQLRELVRSTFPRRSAKQSREPAVDNILDGLLFNGDIIGTLEEKGCQFSDGYNTSGSLLAQFLEVVTSQVGRGGISGQITVDNVSTWKGECVMVHMKHLCSELVETYAERMATYEDTTGLDDFGAVHKAERGAVMEVFKGTVHSLVSATISMKKELQRGIREKKSEKLARIKAIVFDQVKEIYEKHKTLLVKPNVEDMKMTLVDAGSPYSNLVAYKAALANYLSTCKADAAELSKGADDAGVACDIIVGELKDILEKSISWVNAYDILFHESMGVLETNSELHSQLLEEDAKFDAELKEDQARTNAELEKLEGALTVARIKQSSELEERSTKLAVLGDKVERAARLNEGEKNELQVTLMNIQKDIEEVQGQIYEKSQQRENTTDEIHRGMLKDEQDNHGWFKAMIQEQHDLLEKELAVEREIAKTREQQMEQK